MLVSFIFDLIFFVQDSAANAKKITFSRINKIRHVSLAKTEISNFRNRMLVSLLLK